MPPIEDDTFEKQFWTRRDLNRMSSRAEQLAQKVILHADSLNLLSTKADGLKTLSEVYKQSGNFEKAYFAEQQRFVVNQQLINAVLSQAFAEEHYNYLEWQT